VAHHRVALIRTRRPIC